MSSWIPWGRGRRNDDLSDLDSSNSSGSTVERKVKFVFGFRRLVPFLGYHHVLMVLILLAIILLSLLLAGCSSSSVLIPSIFLINLWYEQSSPEFDPAQADPATSRAIANIVGPASLEARVGYFGICINTDGGSWICSANASSLAVQINPEQDPLNLIWVSDTFKESIVFPYLIIIAIIMATIVFLLLATFPGYEEDYDGGPMTRRLPSRAVSQISLAIVFVAAIFVLVSVLWQHTASVAAATIAETMGNGSVEAGIGTTAMVLGWFGFALLIIVTIGLLVMILSMHLVEKLAEGDDDMTESGL